MVKHYHHGKGKLYTAGEKRKFENEYGKSRGDRIFGATVGKVKRERMKHHPYCTSHIGGGCSCR